MEESVAELAQQPSNIYIEVYITMDHGPWGILRWTYEHGANGHGFAACCMLPDLFPCWSAIDVRDTRPSRDTHEGVGCSSFPAPILAS